MHLMTCAYFVVSLAWRALASYAWTHVCMRHSISLDAKLTVVFSHLREAAFLVPELPVQVGRQERWPWAIDATLQVLYPVASQSRCRHGNRYRRCRSAGVHCMAFSHVCQPKSSSLGRPTKKCLPAAYPALRAWRFDLPWSVGGKCSYDVVVRTLFQATLTKWNQEQQTHILASNHRNLRPKPPGFVAIHDGDTIVPVRIPYGLPPTNYTNGDHCWTTAAVDDL